MACKDPSITFLNRFGYNVVRLPRTGIEPMDLLGKDKSMELLGKLSAVWKSTVAAPVPSVPQAAVDVQGKQSDQLELSIGLKILANALKGFGASVPSLDFAFKKARKIQFTFTNVTSTSVAPLDAGNYLAGGDLNTTNPVVRRYLLDEDDTDAQAYLIFDVLKSDSLTVTASADHDADVKLDLPQIQAVVGVDVGVKTVGGSESTITFTGKDAVTFGFKVMQINFVNGRWNLEGAVPSGGLALAVPSAGAVGGTVEQEPVLLGSGFIRF